MKQIATITTEISYGQVTLIVLSCITMHKIDYIATTIAKDQHGIFSRRNLTTAGYANSNIDRYLKSKHIQKISSGIYRSKVFEHTKKSEIFAALLRCPKDSFVSHETALYLYGLVSKYIDIEITTNRNPCMISKQITIHRSQNFEEISTRTIDDLLTCNLEYAILTTASRFPIHKVRQNISTAIVHGESSIQTFRNQLKILTHVKDRSVLVKLLNTLESDLAQVESIFELRVLDIIRKYDLRTPVKQHELKLGTRKIRLDFAYPEKKLYIEADGHMAHSTPTQLYNDLSRQNMLTNAGWIGVRVTPKMKDKEIASFIGNMLRAC